MTLRSFAGRAKRKSLRVLTRVGRAVATVPASVTAEVAYWRSLQREVVDQRDEIRALQEQVAALSARLTTLQREIAPLHVAVNELKRNAD